MLKPHACVAGFSLLGTEFLTTFRAKVSNDCRNADRLDAGAGHEYFYFMLFYFILQKLFSFFFFLFFLPEPSFTNA